METGFLTQLLIAGVEKNIICLYQEALVMDKSPMCRALYNRRPWNWFVPQRIYNYT